MASGAGQVSSRLVPDAVCMWNGIKRLELIPGNSAHTAEQRWMEERNNMEHILQFAVGIDDDAIVKRIEENAEKNITKELRDKVGRVMFGINYRGDEIDAITRWTESVFREYLNEHNDEIVKLAAKCLAEKLSRTKAVKEMLAGLSEEQS